MNKFLVLFTLFLGRCADAQRLTVDVNLQDYLGKVADTATVEHHICLFAIKHLSAQGDTILVMNSEMWPTQTATADFVFSDACPDDAFAAWHNHIRARVEVAFAEFHISIPSNVKGDARACYLSSLDFRTTLREHVRMQIVQVNYRTFCWWTKQEVEERYRRSAPNYAIAMATWPTHVRTDWGQDRRERPR